MRKLRDSIYPEFHSAQLDLYRNASPIQTLIWCHSSFSSYTLDHLLNFLLSMQSESIFGCRNYLCFAHLLRNEVIMSQASLDGVESERLVRCN